MSSYAETKVLGKMRLNDRTDATFKILCNFERLILISTFILFKHYTFTIKKDSKIVFLKCQIIKK